MQDDAKPHASTPPSRPARRARRAAAEVPAGPVPAAGALREAALAHLARFPASEAGLLRVLDRRIQRWSRRALSGGEAAERVEAGVAAARIAARAVAAALVASGVLDDAAYAEAKARSLTRSGRSRRAIGAHLAGRGVASELVQAALPVDPDAELGAALLQARRRRIGPFGDPGLLDEPASRNKALAALGRAGFGRDVAERALGLEPEEAERLILALKRG